MKRLITATLLSLFFLGSAGAADIIKGRVDGEATKPTHNVNVDTSGRVRVDAATGAALIVDDAAFTPATTSVEMSGFTFDDTTPDSVDEGDGGAGRMSANRNQYTTTRDAAGNERGVNVTASNELNVLDSNSGAIKTAVELIDDTVGTHDSTAPTKGIQLGGHAVTALPAAVAAGDFAKLLTDVYGALMLASHQLATNAIRTVVTNSDSELWTPHTTTLTNITANTTAYIYIPMRGKKNITTQWELTESSTDLLTVTLECTTEHDCAPAACGYQDLTNMLCGFASALSSNAAGADEFCIVDTSVLFSYCRVKYNTSNDGGNDADLTVFTTTGY